MALSGVRRTETGLERVESVGAGETVRHVDQLSEAELSAFLAAVDGRRADAGSIPDDGVVVFTDYYRLEQVSR
jgi:hypothetical protein